MKKVAPFIKQSLRSLLDYSLDSLSCSFIIKLFNYSTNRLNGRQYDSHSLEDEAALACHFSALHLISSSMPELILVHGH